MTPAIYTGTVMKASQVVHDSDSADAYPCATETTLPWSDGLPISREWFGKNLGEYVEAFHLQDDNGKVVGHIYWAPSERALAPYKIEDHVAYVYCEWIQREHRGKGGMRMLFDEFADYLHRQGFKGILVDGTDIEEFMHSRHFEKRGFQIIRESENGRLLYYPLAQKTVQVEPLQPKVAPEGKAPVHLLVVGSHFCPVSASAVLALRKVSQEFGENVSLREIPANNQSKDQFGVSNGIFINGRAAFFGPVEEETVRQTLRKEIDAVKKSATMS